ncbi:MAG: Uma2 family endonuclease [Acidobacteriaceae bacterium]|nr:Uma2 family endonuclease [Acidobacteriaceae bacterium]
MATHPISSRPEPDYADDSRFERVDGRWVERPLPGDRHARVQWNVTAALKRISDLSGAGIVHQEWSVTKPSTAAWAEPDYMTPDVLVAFAPIQKTSRGHLIPPGFLAVEITSPEQEKLFTKAQRYHAWGIEHCWIINPQTHECFEYHGGNQFTIVKDTLSAGPISIPIADVFEGIE